MTKLVVNPQTILPPFPPNPPNILCLERVHQRASMIPKYSSFKVTQRAFLPVAVGQKPTSEHRFIMGFVMTRAVRHLFNSSRRGEMIPYPILRVARFEHRERFYHARRKFLSTRGEQDDEAVYHHCHHQRYSTCYTGALARLQSLSRLSWSLCSLPSPKSLRDRYPIQIAKNHPSVCVKER
ncbi:hypothetical protein IE53DRAFT_156928 [Violaceomyces palustris]|uniref:Uncharacterized protein n=1 Tax=Violaceomyces palustris TaxID=1673888 RepID=A0ACD0NTR0_9BASI|nr:hypothetical protein IE53DRAFT_156928 [Violaceomyces palustris]